MTTEKTPIGEQHLITGVAVVSDRERLKLLALLPPGTKKPQKPCDEGLFDDVARAQLTLF
jgi:hypothetical protein